MSHTVRCIRVANILHHGGTFWEPDAWFPFQDRTPEWTSAPVQEVDRDFVPFRQKDRERADGEEPGLKTPFATPYRRGNPLFDGWYESLSATERKSLDKIGRRSKDEVTLVFNEALAVAVLEKQSLPIYRRARGQSHDDRMRLFNDDGDLVAINVPMRSPEDREIHTHGLGSIEHKHRSWLATMAKNGHVEPYRVSPVEARGAGGAWITTTSTKPISSRPLLAQLKPEFLSPDQDDESSLLFNRDWFYIHAVLALTDSEWYAWELLQQGHTAAEIKRFGTPLSAAERYPLVAQAEGLGVELGAQTAHTTLQHLERKLADAREHFSGRRELRPMAPRYRGEFMLGLSSYRATSPARTAAFSDRGYTVRHSALTEIAAANAIRPQADGLTPAERFALGLSTYRAPASRCPYPTTPARSRELPTPRFDTTDLSTAIIVLLWRTAPAPLPATPRTPIVRYGNVHGFTGRTAGGRPILEDREVAAQLGLEPVVSANTQKPQIFWIRVPRKFLPQPSHVFNHLGHINLGVFAAESAKAC